MTILNIDFPLSPSAPLIEGEVVVQRKKLQSWRRALIAANNAATPEEAEGMINSVCCELQEAMNPTLNLFGE